LDSSFEQAPFAFPFEPHPRYSLVPILLSPLFSAGSSSRHFFSAPNYARFIDHAVITPWVFIFLGMRILPPPLHPPFLHTSQHPMIREGTLRSVSWR